jgi:hypothetical protein
MLRRWPVALVTLLFLAPGALPDEENVPPEQVAGWKVYTDVPRLMRIPITDIPGRALRPNPGAAVDLTLTSRGAPVPYWVNDRGDTLVFWGEPDLDSHDARGRCYHLVPKAGGARIQGEPVKWDVESSAATHDGVRTLLPEEKRGYNPIEALDVKSLSAGAREGGYWFYPRKLTFTSDTAGTGKLSLAGIHVIRVHRTPLPGGRFLEQVGLHTSQKPGKLAIKVGDKTFSVDLEKQGASAEIDVPLVAGKNTIELDAEPKGHVLVQRAQIALDAPIPVPDKDHGGVLFVAKGPTCLPLFRGMAADLDTGKLLEVHEGNRASFIKSEKGHRTLLFNPERAIGSSTLDICRKHEALAGDPVDWLAVAPRALTDAVRPLEAHRSAQGYKTRVVAFEDLLDDAADGSFDPAALLALQKLTKRFLLIVGDAWRDGRPDDAGWVPTQLFDTFENGASASDAPFGGKNVAVGRFPCRTPREVTAMVEKTIAYEKAGPGAWQKQLSFVCGEGRFGAQVDGMVENLFNQAVGKRVPAAFDIDVTYANPTSVYFYPPDDFHKRVVERLSNGPLIFDYVGHGAPLNFDDVTWGEKWFPIFSVEDAKSVHCEDGHYPIALITACWTGCFDQPDRTVAETLVLNPKGAVACLAASRISHPFANALLSLELTERLFKDGESRLGERVKGALDSLSLESGGAEGHMVVAFARGMLEEEGLESRLLEDERHLYNLLGDPALQVRLPRRVSVSAPAEAPAGTTVEATCDDKEIASATLERKRAVRSDLQGLDAGTGPEALRDAGTRKRILQTYERANDLVLVKGEAKGARAVLSLPRDLEPGKYVLKLQLTTGEVGSTTLEVGKPAPAKKKYY